MLAAELVKITPSERQLAYQSLGFYAFIHFSVNTFTDKEWGDGTEPESIFNPSELDAEQWVSAVRDAGMKGLILTCKHHDGFCLWQTDTTEHCVRNSPYRNGRGDVVKEVSDACKKYGIRIYYSSVGGNAMLLLNIPPDRRGLFHENDVRRLQEIGAYLKKTFAVNLAETAAFQSDSDDGVHLIENVRHDGILTLDSEDYFKTADGTETATIDIRFGKPVAVSHVVLKENIAKSQRVEEFYIDAFAAGKASEIYAGTVIGYQKIAHFTPVVTDRVRIRITKSRISPTLAFIGVYR